MKISNWLEIFAIDFTLRLEVLSVFQEFSNIVSENVRLQEVSSISIMPVSSQKCWSYAVRSVNFWNFFEAQKVNQLISDTRSICMKEKSKLIQDAENPEDCEWLLKDLIMKTTEDQVDKDDFLVNPPRKHVDELIFELTPEFVNGYVTSSFV